MSTSSTGAYIADQLRGFFTGAGIDVEDTHHGSIRVFVVDGIAYTSVTAAFRFLPGGFYGAQGQPGTVPRYRIGDTARHTPNPGGAPIDVTVVALLGARGYCDGYLAVCLDATGSAHVLPA